MSSNRFDPPVLHRSQKDLWFNSSSPSIVVKVPSLSLGQKSVDGDVVTHSSTLSIVSQPNKLALSVSPYVTVSDAKANKGLLRDLVNYLEEESLGPQEKLRIVRCHQGFLTAFFSYLSANRCETCVLLFLHLEIIKDLWSMLSSSSLRDEILELKMLYIDSNSSLFANISAEACRALTEGLKSEEKLSFRCLSLIEQEINEMVFGFLQNSRYFFERLPDDHPLLQGCFLL
jgi:hypothetical protein